jgi:PEGA domain-containing protein
MLGKLLVVIPLLAAAGTARAQDEALNRAKTLFDEGQKLYAAGQFVPAADSFLAAYQQKTYPAFLFNAAVCREKGGALTEAVDLFTRYLTEGKPEPKEKADVEQRIAHLRERLAPPATPSATPPAPLPEVQPHGLVVVESKPQGATVYLDDRKSVPVGTTPWSATLEGTHTVFVESKGFKPEKKDIVAQSDKMVELYIALSEEHYLGWLEVVSSPVPGADVFFDKREVGAFGKTPWAGNFRPGKHTIWIEHEGFEPWRKDIDLEPGKAMRVEANLQKVSFGMLVIDGKTARGAEVTVDDVAQRCKAMPCRIKVRPGHHEVEIEKNGMKDLDKEFDVHAAEEARLDVEMMPAPSRVAAYVSTVLTAGFVGAGLYFGNKSKTDRNDLQSAVNDPTVVVSPEDSRYKDVRNNAIIADGLFLAGGIAGLSALYYFLRSPGPDSTGDVENKSLVDEPQATILPMPVPSGGAVVGAWGF